MHPARAHPPAFNTHAHGQAVEAPLRTHAPAAHACLDHHDPSWTGVSRAQAHPRFRHPVRHVRRAAACAYARSAGACVTQAYHSARGLSPTIDERARARFHHVTLIFARRACFGAH